MRYFAASDLVLPCLVPHRLDSCSGTDAAWLAGGDKGRWLVSASARRKSQNGRERRIPLPIPLKKRELTLRIDFEPDQFAVRAEFKIEDAHAKAERADHLPDPLLPVWLKFVLRDCATEWIAPVESIALQQNR